MGQSLVFESVDAVLDALTAHQYIADRSLATAIFLSLRLKKPLLLEGEAGVGKTEVAKTLAAILGTPLIRVGLRSCLPTSPVCVQQFA